MRMICETIQINILKWQLHRKQRKKERKEQGYTEDSSHPKSSTTIANKQERTHQERQNNHSRTIQGEMLPLTKATCYKHSAFQ